MWEMRRYAGGLGLNKLGTFRVGDVEGVNHYNKSSNFSNGRNTKFNSRDHKHNLSHNKKYMSQIQNLKVDHTAKAVFCNKFPSGKTLINSAISSKDVCSNVPKYDMPVNSNAKPDTSVKSAPGIAEQRPGVSSNSDYANSNPLSNSNTNAPLHGRPDGEEVKTSDYKLGRCGSSLTPGSLGLLGLERKPCGRFSQPPETDKSRPLSINNGRSNRFSNTKSNQTTTANAVFYNKFSSEKILVNSAISNQDVCSNLSDHDTLTNSNAKSDNNVKSDHASNNSLRASADSPSNPTNSTASIYDRFNQDNSNSGAALPDGEDWAPLVNSTAPPDGQRGTKIGSLNMKGDGPGSLRIISAIKLQKDLGLGVVLLSEFNYSKKSLTRMGVSVSESEESAVRSGAADESEG